METKDVVFKNEVITFEGKNFEPGNGKPFWLVDAYPFMKDLTDHVVCCNGLYIPKNDRSKGKGSSLLQSYIKNNIGNDKLYFVFSGVSSIEYTEEEFENMTDNELHTILDKLDKFYTKNGFIDVNEHFGDYEFKRTYVYNNDIAQKMISNRETFLRECQD